ALPENQGEGAALAQFTHESDPASEQTRQLAAQVQAQSGAFLPPARGRLDAAERGKKLRLIGQADAGTGVVYGDCDFALSARFHRELYAPAVGELDRVVGKVEDD